MQAEQQTQTGNVRPIYQGEPPDPWHSLDIETRAVQHVISLLIRSGNHFAPLRENGDGYFDRYTNQPAYDVRQTSRIQSNIPSGRVSETIDTFIADLLTTMDKARPLISALPEQGMTRDQAGLIERLLQYNLDNFTPDMGWFPKVEPLVFMALLWGGGPAKLVWQRYTESRANFEGMGPDDQRVPSFEDKTIYEGPGVEPVFWYDCYPHPQKEWCNDPFGIIHASWTNFADLKALEGDVYHDVDRVIDFKDMAKYMKLQYDVGPEFSEAYGMIFDDMYKRSEQRATLGWTADSRMEPDGVLLLECECMFRPEVDWTDVSGRHHKGDRPVRAILTLANGAPIRISPTPLLNGNSMWSLTKFNHLPGQFFGQSIVQKIKPMVHLEEVLMNMGVQSVAQVLNRIKLMKPSAFIGPQNVDDQPGGTYFIKDNYLPEQALKEFTTPSVISDALAMMNYAAGRDEGMSGATDLKQGRLPTGERTATASNIAFSQSSKRFRHALIWVGATSFNPWARNMWAYNQAYLPVPHAFQVFGPDAAYFATLTMQELSKTPKFMFMGPTRDEHEAMKIMQLEKLLSTTSAFMEYPWGQNAIKEFIVLLAERFDVMDISRFKRIIQYEEPPSLPMSVVAQLLSGQGQGGARGGNQTIGAAPTGAGRMDRRVSGTSSPTGVANTIAGFLSNNRAA